jgi:hypothetical protein
MVKYFVAPGFTVAGKTGGEEVKPRDVERMDILVESGRVIVKRAESSAMMKEQPAATDSEEE